MVNSFVAICVMMELETDMVNDKRNYPDKKKLTSVIIHGRNFEFSFKLDNFLEKNGRFGCIIAVKVPIIPWITSLYLSWSVYITSVLCARTINYCYNASLPLLTCPFLIITVGTLHSVNFRLDLLDHQMCIEVTVPS